MPTQPDQLRQLPIALGPIHNETVGSYLHRLAVTNNRPAGFLARLLGPLPPEFSPLSNTTAGWTPHSPERLATLSGRPTSQLARALPALADTQQFIGGLMWASSEIERELVQVTHERNILRAAANPEEAQFAQAHARIAALEAHQKELERQLADARRERDDALAVSESLRRELFVARANGTAATSTTGATAVDLAAADDMFQMRAPGGVPSLLEQLRVLNERLTAERQDLRQAAAHAGFSTDIPQKEPASPSAPSEDGPSPAGAVVSQRGDVSRYERAVEVATMATPQDRLAAHIHALRDSGAAERVIEARLIEIARDHGTEQIGGTSAVFDIIRALMESRPEDAKRLLEAMGAYRNIAELRPHLRRHADSVIGLHFLRGMALQRSPKSLSKALHYLRKGTMAISEDRDLAARVVRIIAESATDKRVAAVLPSLARADQEAIKQFRQHRRGNVKIGRPQPAQVTLLHAADPETRVIKGQIVQHDE